MSVDDYFDGLCPHPGCKTRIRRPLDTRLHWSGYDVIAGNRHWHAPPPVTVIFWRMPSPFCPGLQATS